jgi:hypothetical protein
MDYQIVPVVHEREDALLVLTTVLGAENDGHFLLDVEGHSDLGVEPMLLPLGVDLRAGVDDGEVGLEVLDLVLREGRTKSYEIAT